MKKLILFLALIVVMTSCYIDVNKSVENPTKETTTYLQELPKDTVVVSIEDHNLYVFNADNKVMYKTISPERNSLPISGGGVFIILIIFFGLGTLLGVLLEKTNY